MPQFRLNMYLVPLGLAALTLLAACPPLNLQQDQEISGKYIVTATKLYDNDTKFDLRSEAVYPEVEKPFNPSLNVSNEELTANRCTRCHECGFEQAFDWEHYGATEWKPRYRGPQWGPPVDRMNKNPETLLNEEVAERIYNYLRDVTLGTYDESQDNKGAIVVETDQPLPATEKEPTPPADTEPPLRPLPSPAPAPGG